MIDETSVTKKKTSFFYFSHKIYSLCGLNSRWEMTLVLKKMQAVSTFYSLFLSIYLFFCFKFTIYALSLCLKSLASSIHRTSKLSILCSVGGTTFNGSFRYVVICLWL